MDVVYTYTELTTAWEAARRKRWAALSAPELARYDRVDSLAAARGRPMLTSWLLRASLRSVARHAAWARRIYVVTDTPPRWLKQLAAPSAGAEGATARLASSVASRVTHARVWAVDTLGPICLAGP